MPSGPCHPPSQLHRGSIQGTRWSGTCSRPQRQSPATRGGSCCFLGLSFLFLPGCVQVRPGWGSQEIILSLEKLMNRSKIKTSCFPPRSQGSLFLAAPPSLPVTIVVPHQMLKCHHNTLFNLVPTASSDDPTGHTHKGPAVHKARSPE